MSWVEMKKAVNSTVGEPDFKPLDKIMEDLLLPTAELNISTNGEYDVKKYGFARVSVPTTAETPEITISESTGLITADSAGMTGTKQLPTKAEKEYTPTDEDQIINRYNWLTGDQVIKGDPNLIPENIADGKTIFGVVGSFSGAAESASVSFSISSHVTLYYTLQGEEYTEFMEKSDGYVGTDNVSLNSLAFLELADGYPASEMDVSTDFTLISISSDGKQEIYLIDGDGSLTVS